MKNMNIIKIIIFIILLGSIILLTIASIYKIKQNKTIKTDQIDTIKKDTNK